MPSRRGLLVLSLFFLLLPGPAAHPVPLGPEKERTDAHGDPLPPGALCRLGTGRMRQLVGVVCLAFAPDGQTLASVGADDILFLWRVSDGKELRRATLPEEDRLVGNLTFFPDGKLLAFSSTGRGLHFWDVASWKESKEVWGSDFREEIRRDFAFSPDAKTLLWDDGDGLRLRDLRTGKDLRRWRGLRPSHWAGFAFAPDGKTLALGIGLSVAWLDVESGKEIHRIKLEPHGAYSLAFSPDGRLLATGCGSEVRLWETATGKERLPRLADHEGTVRWIRFAPDGKTLLASGGDGRCLEWDLATSKFVQSVMLVPEGTSAYGIHNLALSPDGRTLAWTSRHDAWRHNTSGHIHLTDLRSGQELHPFDDGPADGMAFTPDGKALASLSLDGAVRLWDAATGKELRRYEGFEGELRLLAFSADGKTLVAVQEKEAFVWDAATGALTRRVALLGAPRFWVCALSPDGATLAFGEAHLWTQNGHPPSRVFFWDLRTGKILGRSAEAHGSAVKALAFAPDGQTVVSSCEADHTIRQWDVASGTELWNFRLEQGWATELAFAADGQTLVAHETHHGEHGFEGRWVIRDAATGKERRTLTGPLAAGAALSPDLTLLVQTDRFGEFWLLDVASGKEAGRGRGRAGPPSSSPRTASAWPRAVGTGPS